jgi:hypothetical protein
MSFGQLSRLERISRHLFPEPPFDLGYRSPFWKPDAETEQKSETVTSTPPEAKSAEPVPDVAPVIVPRQRNLGAEVSGLLKSVTEYLAHFTIIEAADDFERGYFNPLDTSPPVTQPKSDEVVGFETQKAALEVELRAFSDRLTEFLAAHRDWRTAELQQQHAAAWRLAREQDLIVAGIEAEHGQAVSELRNLQAALGKVSLQLKAHGAAKPNLDALPSQNDINKWGVENAKLEAAWAVADKAVSAQREHQRDLTKRYQLAAKKKAELRQTESTLRAKLTGEVVWVTGLEKEPL